MKKINCGICKGKHAFSEVDCAKAKELLDIITAPPAQTREDPSLVKKYTIPICHMCDEDSKCVKHNGTMTKGQLEDLRVPMGVSAWKRHGEMYGYDKYFGITWPE